MIPTSVSLSPWVKLPFSHPSSFQKILTMLDTTTILNCRAVCTDWRDWFSVSKTIWSSVLPKVVTRALGRRMRIELEPVWDIRLDLLLEMRDECWTEEQEMSMAIRIERASKQSLWREFEDTLKVITQLHQAFSRGLMSSPCVGPVSFFLRSKVAHPAVLRVMGETLARHLNCVIIDERDKEASVVRQCLLRAMISCHQAPRWVFKDFDLGWLDEEEEEEDVKLAEDEHISCDEEDLTPSKFSLSFIFNSIVNLVSGLFSSMWRMAVTNRQEKTCTIMDSDDGIQEEEQDSLYIITAPTPAHELFPTVLELLDCDLPWLKKMLVDKVGIDKILVVPKFEEVTNHVENIHAQYTVAGLDMAGSVCHLDCGALTRHEGAVVGYVDYPAANFSGEGMGLHYWGGRDVRGRWPQFEQVLEVMGGKEEESEVEWSDGSEEWSEEDVEVEEDFCKDDASDESQTSDLGVSPDLSTGGSEDNLDSSDGSFGEEGDVGQMDKQPLSEEESNEQPQSYASVVRKNLRM